MSFVIFAKAHDYNANGHICKYELLQNYKL
jgi:hypothetical protein